jgi:hypothetical protein
MERNIKLNEPDQKSSEYQKFFEFLKTKFQMTEDIEKYLDVQVNKQLNKDKL